MSYRKINELVYAWDKCTPLAYKLFVVGIANVRIDESNNAVTTISGAELCRLFDTTNSIYSRIEYLCDYEYHEQTIYGWNLLLRDEYSGKLEARQIVIDACICRGILTMRFNNSIIDKIVDLKKYYATFCLQEMLSLKSIYSIRMYEMLKTAYERQRADASENQLYVVNCSLVELRFELGIISSVCHTDVIKELAKENPDYEWIDYLIKKHRCKQNGHSTLNATMLDKIKAELNEKTSMNIDYGLIKEGRKTEGVWFLVD